MSLAQSQLPQDASALQRFEGLLGPAQGGALLRQLHTDRTTLSQDYLAAARRVLKGLVGQADLLTSLPLERKEGSYARNLQAGDALVSIWAMVWGPGAVTCIHDHHCSCCFGVVTGIVSETWYRAVSETHAVPEREYDRMPGHVACMVPSGPNLHRMENRHAADAISIHIYGYDHNAHASSVQREFVALTN